MMMKGVSLLVLVAVAVCGCSAEFSEQLFGEVTYGTDAGSDSDSDVVEATVDAANVEADVLDAGVAADVAVDRPDVVDAAVADARDSAPEAMPEAAPEACASVQHTNCTGGTCPGLSQKYFDCVPVGTLNLAQAHKACVAYASEARCTDNPSGIFGVCADVFTQQSVCWWYGTYSGQVRKDTTILGTWN